MESGIDRPNGDPFLVKRLPLLFFNSAFAVAYAGFLLRETSVRTYATELAYLIPGFLCLFFAACGGIAGCHLLKTHFGNIGAILSPVPILAVSLLVPFLLPLLSMTRKNLTPAALILPLLALPLFFSGLNFAFALRTPDVPRTPLLSGVHNFGAAFSGMLLALLIHSFDNMLLLLLLSGLFLLFPALILYLPGLKRNMLRVAFGLLALLSAAFLIHTTCGFLEKRLSQTDPLRAGKDTIRIDTPGGRSELLRLPDGRFLLTLNGQSVTTIPDNPERHRLTALICGIQPDKKRLRVLLICSVFSGLPEAFAALPLTASLDLVVRDGELLKLAADLDLLPPESQRFRIVIDDPVRFMDQTYRTYDMILVDPPLPQNLDADRLFSSEFYRSASRHLAEGGVFATTLPCPFGYTRESIAELHGIITATMRRIFPNVVFAPGSVQIAFGGERNITNDLDTLDARAAALMRDSDIFPEGLLVILHSQPELQRQARNIIGRSIVSESNSRAAAPLLLSYWRRHPVFAQEAPAGTILRIFDFCLFHRGALTGGILLLYLLFRYFASATVTGKMQFRAVENGFYLAGLFTLTMILFQTAYGSLYRTLGLYGALLWTGIGIGLSLGGRFRIPEHCLKLLSFVLPVFPALPLLTEGIPAPLLSGTILFAAGLSSGFLLREMTAGTDEDAAALFWSMETAGAAAGVILTAFFMIAGDGILPCVGMLMLSRIACLLRPWRISSAESVPKS